MIKTIISQYQNDNKKYIIQLRHGVFCLEQGVDPAIDIDGLDDSATHAIVFDGSMPIATGRILQDGHIGRIAVIKSHRGKGYGALVLNRLISYAKEVSMTQVYLSSQLHAKGFYRKFGFQEYGDIFIDANIEHINMTMSLEKINEV